MEAEAIIEVGKKCLLAAGTVGLLGSVGWLIYASTGMAAGIAIACLLITVANLQK